MVQIMVRKQGKKVDLTKIKLSQIKEDKIRLRIKLALHVEALGPCWIWMGGRNSKGYGYVSLNGKCERLHNYLYKILVGPYDEALTLDHLCRVTSCCRPSHLEPVTRRVNTLRRLEFHKGK